MIRSTLLVLFACALAGDSSAATFDIDFTGLDLVYDGQTIRDSNADGGDPVSITMLADGAPDDEAVTSPATIDFFLPGVVGIDSVSSAEVQSDPGGTLKVSMPGGETVTLSLESVTINYVDLGGVARFAFGGAVAEVMSPSNPTALSLEPAASVSFSARIAAQQTQAGVVSMFVARATGEIEGATLVPEPATGVAVGLMALLGSAAAAMRAKLG